MKTLLSISSFTLLLNVISLAQKDSTVNLHEVQVSSSKIIFNSGLKEYSFDSTLVVNYQHTTLSDLLNENSAVYLKSYGSGSLSTISLRGGSVYHTAILWNGFSLASPLHGLTDLTLENNFFFDDINIQYGGTSSIWGSGAVSGSIHLDNSPTFNDGLKIIAGFSGGSYSDFSEYGGIKWSNNKYSGTLKFFNRNDKNNFTYLNENTNTKEEQIFSVIKQYGIMNENYFRTGKSSILNFRIWLTNSDRQIPPALQQNNTHAVQDDINSRFSAEWKHLGKNFEFAVRSAYFHETVNYDDDFLQQPSNNKCKTFIFESTLEKHLNENHVLLFGVNNNLSVADSSSNLSNIQLNRFAIFTLYRYHSKNEKIELSASARKEFSSVNNSPFIFAGGLNYLPIKSLLLRFAASRVYRNPTLNDLYWSPGGNINLDPENGYSLEDGFQIDVLQISGLKKRFTSSDLKINTTIYYKNINDWIIWYPSPQSIWQPQNLQMVVSKGTEINIDYQYKKNNFSAGCNFEYFYTISTNEKTRLENDASIHQQLIYVPIHRWNGRIFISYKTFGIHFNHSYTGVVYTSSDNTSYLPPYSIDNISADKLLNTGSLSFRIFLKVDNLFNTSYQSVLNRPMPLRTYNAGITFVFTKNNITKK